MHNCKYCNTELNENEVILTDYFQVNLDKGVIYALCRPCYLKEIDRYLAEHKPLCSCGAPEVNYFADDTDETISMGIDEGMLFLICSEAKRLIDAGEKTEEEISEEDEHTINYGFYLRWYPDEDIIWG